MSFQKNLEIPRAWQHLLMVVSGSFWQKFPFKVTLYITVLHSLLFTFKKVAISGIDDQTERSSRPHINLIDPYVIYKKVLSWCGDSRQYSLVG